MSKMKKTRLGRFLTLLLTVLLAVTPLNNVIMPAAPVYAAETFSASSVPAYSDSPYVEVHDNIPYFTKKDLKKKAFEKYSKLDDEGRCGVAYANVCRKIMPKKRRGRIGMIKPSGWHTVKYDGVDGKYLYNRCHLIGYQLSGENANRKNLITGTRYLNVEGMLPFENMVADYVKETNHHVLYRVTPIFAGDNELASGVLMEAESVEDKGEGVEFCVYCYNVQPGITIDYSDGSSSGPAYTETSKSISDSSKSGSYGTVRSNKTAATSKSESSASRQNADTSYVGNSSTMKFHRSSCPSVKQMSGKNKVRLKDRQAYIDAGYSPCKRCKP